MAVEVLTKLPSKVIESKNEATKQKADDVKCKKLETGTFDQSETMDWMDNKVKSKKTDENIDWSQPEKSEPDELVLDWGPTSSVEKIGNDEGTVSQNECGTHGQFIGCPLGTRSWKPSDFFQFCKTVELRASEG